MVTRVRNINAVQFGLVYGLFAALIGLIFALLWLPFGALVAASAAHEGLKGLGAGLGLFAIILFPVMYFIFGFVAGVIGGAVYNLVAGWTGGIEVTLQTAVTAAAPPPPVTTGYSV